MDFKTAYNHMLEGKAIRLPEWKGYWKIDGVTGKLFTHLANGQDITTGDLDLTVKNTLRTDWIYLTDTEVANMSYLDEGADLYSDIPTPTDEDYEAQRAQEDNNNV